VGRIASLSARNDVVSEIVSGFALATTLQSRIAAPCLLLHQEGRHVLLTSSSILTAKFLPVNVALQIFIPLHGIVYYLDDRILNIGKYHNV